MARGHYWILIVGLLVVGWTLHVLLCDWRYKLAQRGAVELVAWDHGADPTSSGRWGNPHSGLFAGSGVPVPIAGIFGVSLPVAMVFAAAFVAVSARQSQRRAAGRCLACGHQLAGASVCPECGTNSE